MAVRVYSILHLEKFEVIRVSSDVDQTVEVREVVYLIVDDFISIEFNQSLSVSPSCRNVNALEDSAIVNDMIGFGTRQIVFVVLPLFIV